MAVLNLIGFGFTVVLATLWGITLTNPPISVLSNPSSCFSSSFMSPSACSLPYANPRPCLGSWMGHWSSLRRPSPRLWQARLVADMPNGLAWSSLALGCFYLLLAMILVWRAGPNFRMLSESYLALAAIFVTLTIPFTFTTQITAVIWALEGAGLVWAGLRQQRRFHVLLGGLAQLAAGFWLFVYLFDVVVYSQTGRPIMANVFVLGGFVLAVAGLFTAWLFLDQARREDRFFLPGDLRLLEVATAIWAMAWWFGAGIYAIVRFAPPTYMLDGAVIFLAVSAGVGEWVGGRLRWPAIRVPALLLWAVAVVLAAVETLGYRDPLLAYAGWVAWPLVVIIHFWTLYRRQPRRGIVAQLSSAGALADRMAGNVGDASARMAMGSRGDDLDGNRLDRGAPLLLMLGVTLLGRRLPWPTGKHFDLYIRSRSVY